MNAILELLVIGSISLAAICQTITVYEKMLLSPNEGEDAAVYCVGQVCVSCKDRTKSSTDERHKEIKLDTATFVFIMISLVTCVADVLARRVTKSSHAFCVRFMWYVTAASLLTGTIVLVLFSVTQSHLPQCFIAAMFTVLNGILALTTGFLFRSCWQHKPPTLSSLKAHNKDEII